MITAIITQIKTGAVTNVIAKFDGIVNPTIPYIQVYEASRVVTGNGQAVSGYFVSYHVNRGQQDLIEAYMNKTIVDLLHNIVLTDSNGNNFRLQDTTELSVLVDSNDDGSISKDRLFSLPILGAV